MNEALILMEATPKTTYKDIEQDLHDALYDDVLSQQLKLMFADENARKEHRKKIEEELNKIFD